MTMNVMICDIPRFEDSKIRGFENSSHDDKCHDLQSRRWMYWR